MRLPPPPLSPSASSASTGSATSPSSRPPSAPPPYCELLRLLVRSSLLASDPVHKPAAHLQHGARRPHPSVADADAPLERALLRTWRFLSDPYSGSSRLHLARSFDRRSWRRLGLLLFSTNQWLVTAAAAVLEAALYPFLVSGEHIRIIHDETEAHVADPSDPHPQLREAWSAVRSSALLDSVYDKLKDCAALLAALPKSKQGRATVSSAGDPTVAVAARLVRVVGAAVAFSLVERRPTDCPTDRGLELLRDLTRPELSQHALPTLLFVQVTALRELSTLQQLENAITATVEAKPILPAPLLLLYLDELLETALTVSASNITHLHAVDSLRIKCWLLYLDLLTGAAPYQRPPPVVDAVLTLCDALLVASDDSLQHAALRWLHALLNTPPSPSFDRVEYAEALARAMRLSGALRTLSWLLAHSELAVRDQAAAVLSLVERHSPPADLMRALIEQGCVAIYRVVVEQQHHASDRDPGSKVAAHLIRRARRELGEHQPFLVRACCHAIRHSTNAALRVNVVLALHIIRGRVDGRDEDSSSSSAGERVRKSLQAENFVDDVLLPAIEDIEHDDGGGSSFAKALLAVLANTCDPLSLLKLERGASRRSSSSVLNGADTSSVDDKRSRNCSTLTIYCAGGASVDVDLDLMAANSARARRHVDGRAPNPSIAAEQVGADAVKLVVRLLSSSSTSPLASEADEALLDALQAARELEMPAAWHAAARALIDRLSAGNWADLALGALRVRHPALAIRAVRHGISSSSSSDADLACVAAAMSREFFRDW